MKSAPSDLTKLLQEGAIALPTVLFLEYKRIGLTEKEVVLLIHILLFREKQQNLFPAVHELEDRMNLRTSEIIQLLQRLIQGGFLRVEESTDSNGEIREVYTTTPLMEKLINSYMNHKDGSYQEGYRLLFDMFERELGRTLSPMECESLARWTDEDGYSMELIEAALREAVFCEKVSFRYIDRILLEWERQGIKTVDDAIEYARRYRQKGVLYQAKEEPGEYSFYD